MFVMRMVWTIIRQAFPIQLLPEITSVSGRIFSMHRLPSAKIAAGICRSSNSVMLLNTDLKQRPCFGVWFVVFWCIFVVYVL